MQGFSVCPLSEPWLLEILYKVDPRTQTRLRQTCKRMDTFVETYRFKIAKYSRTNLTLYIQFKNRRYCLDMIPSWSGQSIMFTDPFKELSAFHFETINFMNSANTVVSENERNELSTLMEKMRFQCGTFRSFRPRNTGELVEAMEHISMEHLKFSVVEKVSLQTLFSSRHFQDIKKLTLQFDRTSGNPDFPENGLLEHLKHLSSICMDFSDISNFRPNNIIEMLLREICNSNDTGSLSDLQFKIPGNVNFSQISMDLRLVLKYSTDQGVAKDLMFQTLPSQFIIVQSNVSGNANSYEISITILKKNIYQLRKTLIEIAGETTGDIAFKKILKHLPHERKV